MFAFSNLKHSITSLGLTPSALLKILCTSTSIKRASPTITTAQSPMLSLVSFSFCLRYPAHSSPNSSLNFKACLSNRPPCSRSRSINHFLVNVTNSFSNAIMFLLILSLIARDRPITAVLPMFFCISRSLLVSCSRCRSNRIDRLINSISIIISIYFTKIGELLCSPFSEKLD